MRITVEKHYRIKKALGIILDTLSALIAFPIAILVYAVLFFGAELENLLIKALEGDR